MRLIVVGGALIGVVLAMSCAEQGTPATRTPPPGAASQTPAPSEPTPTPPVETGNAERLVLGREAYQEAMCSMCHGAEGRGNSMGPDLTSAARVHSDGSVEGILAVLEAGVPKGEIVNPRFGMAMPSAKEIVADPDRLRALAEYVASLSK